MHSIEWRYAPLSPLPPSAPSKEVADDLCHTLLTQRGLDSEEKQRMFLHPSFEDLHDVFLMHNVEKAALRLLQAIKENSPIFIYGDYDADGICSVALCIHVLRALGFRAPLHYRLAHRQHGGYGLSLSAIQEAAQHQAAILISMDCGTKDFKAARKAHDLGIDLIICDHHAVAKHVPLCHSFINPWQTDCAYPYKHLCACAVGFKLMQALCRLAEKEDLVKDYLYLVAISTLADVVPLVGENKCLVQLGMQQISSPSTIGLHALIDFLMLRPPLSTRDITFSIIPHMNAPGRLDSAEKTLQLLLATDETQAQQAAKILIDINTQRKQIQQKTQEEAFLLIEKEDNSAYCTLLYQPHWHLGVLGIVAARCVEEKYMPAAVMGKDSDGNIVGSARSIENINVHDALVQCKAYLLRFGGHRGAAGFCLKQENLHDFKQAFEKAIQAQCHEKEGSQNLPSPYITLHYPLRMEDISLSVLHMLERFAPFGTSNPTPLFYDTSLHITGLKRIGKDATHLSGYLFKNTQPNHKIRALAFHKKKWFAPLSYAEKHRLPIHIAYELHGDKFYSRNARNTENPFYILIQDIKFD